MDCTKASVWSVWVAGSSATFPATFWQAIPVKYVLAYLRLQTCLEVIVDTFNVLVRVG